jgi:hypothetical protein
MGLRLAATDRVPLQAAGMPIPTLISRQQQQQRPFWCWAACAAMMVETKTQCQIATSQLPPNNCCGLPESPVAITTEGDPVELGPCDRTRSPEELLALWQQLSVRAERLEGRLIERTLRQRIQEQRPVQVWQGATGAGSQHVLLVVGADAQHLVIADPFLEGFAIGTYEDLIEQRGGWRRSYVLR